MSAIDRYVAAVMERIAPGIPGRDRIEEDLRIHLAERAEAEGGEAAAIERMGDPDEVARSFLAGIEPALAGAGPRLGAFLFDAGICGAFLVAAFLLAAVILDPAGPGEPSAFEVVQVVLVAILLVAPALLYFPVLEERYGQTPGKRLFGIYVAKESGERAGLGATVVRRLPLLFEVWWLDALFVFFTENRQRAFDIVAKTVVVDGGSGAGRGAAWAWVLAPWLVTGGMAALLTTLA